MMVYARDYNGWISLHEAAWVGHVKLIEALVHRGVDINEMRGSGKTELRLAQEYHNEHHPVVAFLESIGALTIGSDL